jgi:glycosyltransferase involved in cell wall biosynthesis
MNNMVSVIIPTYNRANTIESSIRSVLNQTYTNIEIIVVDDASQDNTEEVVNSINDNRILYIRNNENQGVASARNIGAQYAKGEFIAFNDSDDIWHYDKLEKQMDVMLQNNDCNLVYCAFNRFLLNGTRVRIPDMNENISDLEGNIFTALFARNTISTQTMLLRTGYFMSIGGFQKNLRCLDDYELALRIAKNNKIYFVNEELVDVMESDNSISILEKNYFSSFDSILYMVGLYWDEFEDKSIFEINIKSLLVYISFMPLIEAVDAYKKIIKYIKALEPVICDVAVSCTKYKNKDFIMRKLVEEPTNIWINKIKDMNVKNVVVYGNGYIGKILCNLLENDRFKISYIIDRNSKDSKYSIFSTEDNLPETDLVIISVIHSNDDIRTILESKINAPIVYIEELLLD